VTGHSTSEQRERGGVVAWRIRTGANGGSEWAEAGSLEGSGGARSQASGEPGHEERNREREREATTPWSEGRTGGRDGGIRATPTLPAFPFYPYPVQFSF